MPELITICRVLKQQPKYLSSQSLDEYKKQHPESYNLACEVLAKMALNEALDNESKK